MSTRRAALLASTALGQACNTCCSSLLSRPVGSSVVRTLATASNEASEASTSGQEALAGYLGREIKPGKKKDPPLSWLYMREGKDGVKRLMPLKERLIWGAVLGGIGYFFVPRIYNSRIKAAEEKIAAQKREEELVQRRITALRVLLSGNSWLHDESDALEGMTPKQIVDFMRQHNINPEDPFEGMEPEEIDEFVRKTGISI